MIDRDLKLSQPHLMSWEVIWKSDTELSMLRRQDPCLRLCMKIEEKT